jgi:hypothetical protein
MPVRKTRKVWTEADCERLKALVAAGASPVRASLALGHPTGSTKNKARELGVRFPNQVETRRKIRKMLETN